MVDEKLLQFIWQYRCYNPSALTTIQGETVTVIYPGRYNYDGGPDFLEAILLIGNTKWAGHVEIHTKESLWHTHGHSNDDKYRNVILHVVIESDLDTRALPTLSLEGRIAPSLLASYRRQMEQKQLLPCQSDIQSVPEIVFTHWRERMMVERLQYKAQHILALLSELNNDWNQVAFILVSSCLGLPSNTEAMERLARAIDYKIMLKNGDSIFTAEAMLFGVAGMLADVPVQDYTLALQKEYLYQKQKYHLKEMTLVQWQWLRMRPASFPTVRIAQLAAICTTLFPFMEKIVENQLSFLSALEHIETSKYWQRHYTFEKTGKERKKHIGKDLSNRIGSNVVAPLLIAYGIYKYDSSYQDKAIDLISSLPPEENTITKKFLGISTPSLTSAHTQGLLQLYKNYCVKKKCLDCAIGCHILKKSANLEIYANKPTFEIQEEEILYARA